ncbi:MAG: FHA domain-containing protein [Candidatus Aquicultorales bacterium]
MKCRKCGTENKPIDLKCVECGELLDHTERTMALPPIDIDDPAGIVEPSAQLEPSLVVTKGPVLGQRFDIIKGEVTLGRDPGNDIFLDDVTVSRKHARIMIEKGSLLIEDVGSLNGTYVNNQRVEKRNLSDGDELQIGKYKLLFVPGQK